MSSGGFALIPILLGFGLAAGMVGRWKGGSFLLWFSVGFFVPFLGLAAAALHRPEREELRRQCPGCGRVVKLHDALCTRCGTELDFPEVALAAEAPIRVA